MLPWIVLQCVIVVFPDHTHFFFMLSSKSFITSDKIIGHRIDRWGTTDNTGTGSAARPSKTPCEPWFHSLWKELFNAMIIKYV